MKLLACVANMAFMIMNCWNWFGVKMTASRLEKVQAKNLRTILKRNKHTDFGKRYCFEKMYDVTDFVSSVPKHSYEDFQGDINQIMAGKKKVLTREEISHLAISSGTCAASKLIPFTQSFRKEYNRAINAWLFDLYLQYPKLMAGTQFWIISPTTETDSYDSKVPVGFLSDKSYLGRISGYLMRLVMCAPDDLSKIHHQESYIYKLCYYLLRDRDLRLISVWNPSLLMTIISYLRKYYRKIIVDLAHEGSVTPKSNVASRRSNELRHLGGECPDNLTRIWPHLQLISCWDRLWAGIFIPTLQSYFPGVKIQGKGLLATEGIVSIPWKNLPYPMLAFNAHFYEFKSLSDMQVYLSHELTVGNLYEVLLTTSAGFYRYKLKDVVEVKGFYKAVPLVDFKGKNDRVSDLTGEKLNEVHVEDVIRFLCNKYLKRTGLIFICPSESLDGLRYVLCLDESLIDPEFDKHALLTDLDTRLCENYHYRHSRQMEQLKSPVLKLLNKSEKADYLQWKKGDSVRSTKKISRLEVRDITNLFIKE